jgi:hypothetical protein
MLRGHLARSFPPILHHSPPIFKLFFCLYFPHKAKAKQNKRNIILLPGHLCPRSPHHYGNGKPPPVISATTTEVIDFSIEFGFAILNYIPL